MRFLKLYGGILLILIAVAILALGFYNVLGLDKATYNVLVLICGVLVVLGVVFCFVGGKSADKIGGK